jgi:exodeoxyribonuclease V alpha subunit
VRAPAGLRGAAYWSTLVARWLAEVQPVVPREDGHYVGEPLMVTTNDYEVGLYNGDTGVVYDDAVRGLTPRSAAAARRSSCRSSGSGACRGCTR